MMQAMATDSAIGTRIRKRRQVLGMTQDEFAARLNVSRSTVANWESGKHFPLRYLGLVEEVLGVSLDEAEEPLEIPPDLQELLDNLTDRQREYVIDRLRAGQELRRSRSQDRRRSAG